MSDKIRIGIVGALGKMGLIVTQAIKNDTKLQIGYLLDTKIHDAQPKALFDNADVIIDFSTPNSTNELLKYATDNNRRSKIIICTTGLEKQHWKMIQHTASKMPIVYAQNTSIGICLIIQQVKQMVAVLKNTNGINIDIIDTHHNQKQDNPSGTALLIANTIKKILPDINIILANQLTNPRQANQLVIHSIRSGTNPGKHEIIFAFDGQTINLTHQANTKKIFAQGAIDAAKWIYNQNKATLFSMNDVYNITPT